MQLRKATIIEKKIDKNELQLSLFIDPSLIYFHGHFHDFPILPGVTQIDWAIYYGKKLLNCPDKFSGMEVIKFQEAILPSNTVLLNLQWNNEKGMLYFSYRSQCDGQIKKHSSGRIKLVAAI